MTPEHLKPESKVWFENVISLYELEPHHLKLLALAAESWDRYTQAREAIAEHGPTYNDRFNAPRLRPEVIIERDSRLAFARLIRELDLDVDPPTESKRPPSLRSNRK